MKVLVVDDEKLARERLVRMIGTLDAYDVIGEAASGDEAIRKTIEIEPDIVLLDIRMPGTDGIEAGRGLIEEQDLGVERHGARDGGPLRHSATDLGRHVVLEALKPDHAELARGYGVHRAGG